MARHLMSLLQHAFLGVRERQALLAHVEERGLDALLLEDVQDRAAVFARPVVERQRDDLLPLRARVQRHDDRVLRLDGDAFVHMLAGTFPDPVFVHAVFPGLLEYLYRAACDADAFAVRHGLLSHGMVFGHILA